jgi:hypothetical protein
MSMSPSQLGAFARSSPERAWANVQYHVQPLSLPAFGEPLDRFNAFTASVCNLNPTARGQVRIASADPKAAPLIEPRYLSTPEDRQVAAESLRLTRRIVAQPALADAQAKANAEGWNEENARDYDDALRGVADSAADVTYAQSTLQSMLDTGQTSIGDAVTIFRNWEAQGLLTADAVEALNAQLFITGIALRDLQGGSVTVDQNMNPYAYSDYPRAPTATPVPQTNPYAYSDYPRRESSAANVTIVGHDWTLGTATDVAIATLDAGVTSRAGG